MSSTRSPFRTALCLVALSAALLPARAADETLKGIVRDPAKSPIAGATVIATNEATRASQTTTTAADGSYSFALAPGSYSVRAASARFRGPAVKVEVKAGAPGVLDFDLSERMTEVVVVTATKNEEAPIDVPFSVAAHTGQDLEDRGVNGIEDIAANVGSFAVQNLGPGQSQVAMRGVSSGQIVRDQPGVKEQVGVYLDESPVSLSLFTPDLELIDMDRVEVLRGPQGTLFGAGSETGAVRYVTHQPVQGVTEGFVELGGAVVQDGSPAGDVKAGLNVPLGDKVALRIAGYYTKTPGATDAVQPGFSVDEDVNDGFRTGARAAVTYAPNSALSITPRIVYQRLEIDGWNLEDIYNILANPFTTTRPDIKLDDRQEFTQLEESFKDDFLMGDLDIRYDFGPVALTSVTSYIDRDVNVVRDTTALSASFTGGTAGFPEPIYTLDSPLFDNTKSKVFTQEFRLTGGKDRLKWLAGAFYSNAERDYGQDVKIIGFEDATGIPTEGQLATKDTIFFSTFEFQLDQFGVFGEATYSFTPKFDLTAGLRYYDYNEDKTAFIDGVFGNPNFPGDPLSLPGSVEADGLAPRLIAAWKLSPAAILNAQVSKGFRLGGINDPLNVPLCSPQDLQTFGRQDTWDDEEAWNYEAGIKSLLMSGRASLNAAVFYMDIDNLQTTVTAGTCSSRVVFNVPKARSRGLEFDFNASPGAHWDVGISGSYNDSEIRSTLTSTDLSGNESVVSGIEAGRRLPSVPEIQAAFAATYKWDLSSNSRMYITGVYQHVGSRYTQVGDQDLGTLNMLDPQLPNTIGGPLTQNTFRYDPKLPAYDLLNLRWTWERNAWNLVAYVNNATDELALLSLDRERGTLARIGYLTNQPRTFGVTTGYRF